MSVDPPDPAATPSLPSDPPSDQRSEAVSPELPAWRALLGSLALAGLAGVPLGVGWWLLAPRIRVEITHAGAVFAPGNPSDWFGREGWFGVLGLVLGAVAGLLAHRWWGRRPVAALLGVTLGGLLASAVGYELGRLLGPGALPTDVSSLPPGTIVGAPLKIIAPAVFLAVSFAAVLAFGVAVALERDDVPDDQPREGGTGESDPALAR